MAQEYIRGAVSLGDFKLDHGETLTDAQLGFACWSDDASMSAPVVVLPSYFSGDAESYAPWVGADGLFDPKKYSIIAFDQFGAGLSSKPSWRDGYASWPYVTLSDCVRAQRDVLQRWGIEQVALVAGWSMGGMQAFRWHDLYRDNVHAIFALCATPFTSSVNRVFLQGIKSILLYAKNPVDFDKQLPEELRLRLRTFGKVYAGWAYSIALFEHVENSSLGFRSVDELLSSWARDHEGMSAADLLAQLDMWLRESKPIKQCSIDDSHAIGHDGDHASHAKRQHADSIVMAMPCETDRYFPEQVLLDITAKDSSITVVSLHSDLGHMAGHPGIREQETATIKQAVGKVLRSLENVSGNALGNTMDNTSENASDSTSNNTSDNTSDRALGDASRSFHSAAFSTDNDAVGTLAERIKTTACLLESSKNP